MGNIGTAVARHLVGDDAGVVVAAKDPSHADALAPQLRRLRTRTSVEDALTDAAVVVFALWLDDMKRRDHMVADYGFRGFERLPAAATMPAMSKTVVVQTPRQRND